MRKKIFTLCALGFLLSGALSTVKAQINLSNTAAGWAITGTDVAYEGCQFTLNFKFDGGNGVPPTDWTNDTVFITVPQSLLDYTDIASQFSKKGNDLYLLIRSKTGTFSLTITVAKDIPLSYNNTRLVLGFFWQPAAVKGTSSLSLGPATINLYSALKYEIKFYADRGPKYKGLVELTKTGGSGQIYYSIRGGENWAYNGNIWNTSSLILDPLKIQNLTSEWDIRVYDMANPCNSYGEPTIIIPVPDGLIAPDLKRPVFIPLEQTGYKTFPAGGIYFVQSTKSFTFNVQPTGENEGKKPVVTVVDRKVLPAGAVSVSDPLEIADGVWSVTINSIQEEINLDIRFAEEETTGNAVADDAKAVIGGKGLLYISSAQAAGTAKIYNIVGAQVKTVAYAAGQTTSVALASGVYIVALTDGKYKVIVK